LINPAFARIYAYRRPCTFFGIINALAAGVEQLHAKGELNQENVDALNLKIAQEMGFVWACL
jgi:hypothetical protein